MENERIIQIEKYRQIWNLFSTFHFRKFEKRQKKKPTEKKRDFCLINVGYTMLFFGI